MDFIRQIRSGIWWLFIILLEFVISLTEITKIKTFPLSVTKFDFFKDYIFTISCKYGKCFIIHVQCMMLLSIFINSLVYTHKYITLSKRRKKNGEKDIFLP